MNRDVRPVSHGGGGVPDFTAQVESPDSNRVARKGNKGRPGIQEIPFSFTLHPSSLHPTHVLICRFGFVMCRLLTSLAPIDVRCRFRQDRPMTLEQSLWRSEYMAKAKSRNLKYLDDMRIIQVPEPTAAGGPRLIIVSGAFIKPCSVNMTDLLYYAVKTADPVVRRPYSVVYFHTDTQLPALLDVGWFSQLHDAIDPAHRENLRGLYIVHPSLRLRMWLLLLKVLEPSIYGKVEFVDNIPALCRLVPGLDPETGIPQHVKDASGFY